MASEKLSCIVYGTYSFSWRFLLELHVNPRRTGHEWAHSIRTPACLMIPTYLCCFFVLSNNSSEHIIYNTSSKELLVCFKKNSWLYRRDCTFLFLRAPLFHVPPEVISYIYKQIEIRKNVTKDFIECNL